MPSGKQRTSRAKPVPKRASKPERRDDADPSVERRLAELAEAVNIMIPELSARVAALEHVLVEKQLCRRADLMRARQFVDMRGGDE